MPAFASMTDPLEGRMREPVYEVFARKTREEPLRHVGFINALDPALARVSASTTYDEQNWFEMCVVPRAAIVPVKLEGEPCTTGVPDALAEMIRAAGTGAYGGDEVATVGT
jgi:1,2-phenylacetyl-CoA epoxidase PaaB subunit